MSGLSRVVMLVSSSSRCHVVVARLCDFLFVCCSCFFCSCFCFFFFQAEDGIRDGRVTGVQTCALPIFTVLWLCCWFRSVTVVVGPAVSFHGVKNSSHRFTSSQSLDMIYKIFQDYL